MAEKLTNTEIKLGEGTLLKEALHEHLTGAANVVRSATLVTNVGANVEVRSDEPLKAAIDSAMGTVTLFGRLRCTATKGSGTVWATLPSNYRPLYQHVYVVDTTAGHTARVAIQANGDIQVHTEVNQGSSLSLSGVIFTKI